MDPEKPKTQEIQLENSAYIELWKCGNIIIQWAGADWCVGKCARHFACLDLKYSWLRIATFSVKKLRLRKAMEEADSAPTCKH